MRLIAPDDLRKLKDEINPYLVRSSKGTTFKEGTPDEIKEKFEIWKKRYRDFCEQNAM